MDGLNVSNNDNIVILVFITYLRCVILNDIIVDNNDYYNLLICIFMMCHFKKSLIG